MHACAGGRQARTCRRHSPTANSTLSISVCKMLQQFEGKGQPMSLKAKHITPTSGWLEVTVGGTMTTL